MLAEVELTFDQPDGLISGASGVGNSTNCTSFVFLKIL